MQILEYIVVPVISLAVLFGITKMMGYRQVSQLNMYDYIRRSIYEQNKFKNRIYFKSI